MYINLSKITYPVAGVLLGTLFSSSYTQNSDRSGVSLDNTRFISTLPNDVYEKSHLDNNYENSYKISDYSTIAGAGATKNIQAKITPKGTSDHRVLSQAPSANIKVKGVNKKARIVVDLTTNVLYYYDENGEAQRAYSVASGAIRGKNAAPTPDGAYVVCYVENYPYRNAPRTSKRYKNPRDYGPKIIILRKLDKRNGETSETGVFIHGNRNASTIGKYVSHGCIRMDNEVIKYLSDCVQSGDIVLFLPNNRLYN